MKVAVLLISMLMVVGCATADTTDSVATASHAPEIVLVLEVSNGHGEYWLKCADFDPVLAISVETESLDSVLAEKTNKLASAIGSTASEYTDNFGTVVTDIIIVTSSQQEEGVWSHMTLAIDSIHVANNENVEAGLGRFNIQVRSEE